MGPIKPPIPNTAEVSDIIVLRNLGTCSRDKLAKADKVMVPNNIDMHRIATEIHRSGIKTNTVPVMVVRIPAMAIEFFRPHEFIRCPAKIPPITDIIDPIIIIIAPKLMGIPN